MPNRKDIVLINLFRNRNYQSIKEDLKFGEYFGEWDDDIEDLTKHSLCKKAKDHVTFLLLVFMRFRETFKDGIDKFLFLDIMKFLPSGSFLHFNSETIRHLSVKKMLFEHATFRNTVIMDCHLCYASFANTLIEDCTFGLSCLEEANFCSAKIKNTTFEKVNLTSSWFSSTELNNVTFTEVSMVEANFKTYNDKKTLLKDCLFERCDMSRVWFVGNTELYDTNFITCNLCYSKFSKRLCDDSLYLSDCGVKGFEIDGYGYFNPGGVPEIDWLDDVPERMWEFEPDAHLPYSLYSH